MTVPRNNDLLHYHCHNKTKILTKMDVFMKELLGFLEFLKINKNYDISDMRNFAIEYIETRGDFTDEEIVQLFNNPAFEKAFVEYEIYA